MPRKHGTPRQRRLRFDGTHSAKVHRPPSDGDRWPRLQCRLAPALMATLVASVPAADRPSFIRRAIREALNKRGASLAAVLDISA